MCRNFITDSQGFFSRYWARFPEGGKLKRAGIHIIVFVWYLCISYYREFAVIVCNYVFVCKEWKRSDLREDKRGDGSDQKAPWKEKVVLDLADN